MRIVAAASAGTGLRAQGAGQPTIRWTRMGLVVSVPWSGRQWIRICTPQGRLVYSAQGAGPRKHVVADKPACGRYLVLIEGNGATVRREIVAARHW